MGDSAGEVVPVGGLGSACSLDSDQSGADEEGLAPRKGITTASRGALLLAEKEAERLQAAEARAAEANARAAHTERALQVRRRSVGPCRR